MSRQTARNAFDQFNGRPALIAPAYLGNYLRGNAAPGLAGDLMELAAVDPVAEAARFQQRKGELCEAYGLPSAPNDKPFAFSNGVAVIPIHGVLINRFAYSWGFVTGYNFIRSQVEATSKDDDVKFVIYDVNSYGGMVSGCVEAADAVYATSKRGGGKPSLAVVDANCYSAAYKVASGADRMVLTPSGGVGSIGVVLMHMDMSKMLSEIGITVTFIKAGAHKVDGNSYEPLAPDVIESLQAEINKMYDVFVSRVVKNRKISDQSVRDTEARCFYADDALALGLVDSISTPDEAVTSFFDACEAGELDGPTEEPDDEDDTEEPDDDEDDKPVLTPEGLDMATTPVTTANTPAATAPVVDAAATAAEARQAERARISGIQSHAEAAERPKLAAHLALNTDMTIEAAASILAVSAKETPIAAKEAPIVEKDRVREAMNADKTPNVLPGASAGGSEGTGELKGSARILAAYRAETGRKAPKAA